MARGRAWPRSPRPRRIRRAALGGLGWLWLAIAGELTRGHLAVAAPLHAGAPAWLHEFGRAVSDVLLPTLGPSVLAPAALWAVASAVLPWLLHRTSAAADALVAVLWAVGLYVLTEALSAPTVHARSIVRPDITVLSVLVGALCALAPSLLAARFARGAGTGFADRTCVA